MTRLRWQTEQLGPYQPLPVRMDYVITYLRARALELRNLAITTRDARASQELYHLAHLFEEKAVILERRQKHATQLARPGARLRAER